MDTAIIYSMSYDEIFEYMIKKYMADYGQIKFKSVFEKVMSSNKVSGLLSKARAKVVAPNENDYLYCLNEMPFFIFSKFDTQAIGALIALERWNKEVNSQQNLKSKSELKSIAMKIIQKS